MAIKESAKKKTPWNLQRIFLNPKKAVTLKWLYCKIV